MRNFREYYKPDTWFMNENKQIVLSSVRQGFTLSSTRFPELCRTARRLVKPLEHGGEYVVYDVYEHSVSPASDSQEKELLRVLPMYSRVWTKLAKVTSIYSGELSG